VFYGVAFLTLSAVPLFAYGLKEVVKPKKSREEKVLLDSHEPDNEEENENQVAALMKLVWYEITHDARYTVSILTTVCGKIIVKTIL